LKGSYNRQPKPYNENPQNFIGLEKLELKVENNPFLALLLITGLAFVVPIFANRFRRVLIPTVVGEIFAGMIIGYSGLNLVHPSETLTFLAEFGFAYLMFLSGLEVDLNQLLKNTGLKKSRSFIRPLPIAILIFIGTLGLALVFSLILSRLNFIESPFLLSLILSTTSLGVVVPVLKERDLLGSSFGQVLLVTSTIADFGTLLLLTVIIAVQSHGLTFDLLLIPLLLLIFVLAARSMQRFSTYSFPQRILKELSSATSQIRIRGAFALMVAWVVLAEALGVELILGAFLAGVIAGLISDPNEDNIKDKLDAIGYGFFIPIFFIMVGVEFRLQALFESPNVLLLIPLLILIAFAIKVLPSLLFKLSFSWRQTLSGGFLLSSRLSLIIAASSIALGLGLINEAVNSAIILLAIFSCTFSPMIFNRIFSPSDERTRQGIIILGKDLLTEYLVERLLTTGERITVVCPDQNRAPVFQKLRINLISDCIDIPDILKRSDAKRARVLIDLTSTVEETMEVCSLAHDEYEIPIIISRISDVDLIPRLQSLGVRVVQPALATAMALEGALRYPTIFDVLIQKTYEDIDVAEVAVTNISLSNQSLGQLQLPGDVKILSMQRGTSVMVPDHNAILKLGDRLGLIGSPHSLEEAVNWLKTRG
jgi:Kef-type K+ transport system membrane component KefB/Trk K+ transport system NAD-binding subunit